jgi:hypothetical protein
MTVGAAAGEARDVLDRGNAPVQAAHTVPMANARRESRVDHGVGSPHEMPFSVAAPQHLAESRYSAGWYQPRQNASSQVLLSRMAEMIKPTIE